MLPITWNQAIRRCPTKHLCPNDNHISGPPRTCSACPPGAGNSLRRTWRPVNCLYGLNLLFHDLTQQDGRAGNVVLASTCTARLKGTHQMWAQSEISSEQSEGLSIVDRNHECLLFASCCVLLYIIIIQPSTQQIHNKLTSITVWPCRFSSTTSASPANHQSTNFSIIILAQGCHNWPVGGRSAEWTQLDSTPPLFELKNYCTNICLL
jgi:hypothetical protein